MVDGLRPPPSKPSMHGGRTLVGVGRRWRTNPEWKKKKIERDLERDREREREREARCGVCSLDAEMASKGECDFDRRLRWERP